jgi:hypothetical protein
MVISDRSLSGRLVKASPITISSLILKKWAITEIVQFSCPRDIWKMVSSDMYLYCWWNQQNVVGHICPIKHFSWDAIVPADIYTPFTWKHLWKNIYTIFGVKTTLLLPDWMCQWKKNVSPLLRCLKFAFLWFPQGKNRKTKQFHWHYTALERK